MKPGVVMSTLLTVLQVLVALLLICVVLIQEPKSTGGGLFSGTGQSLDISQETTNPMRQPSKTSPTRRKPISMALSSE